MNKPRPLIITLILTGIALAGCKHATTITPTLAIAAPPRAIISEVMAGVQDNNNYEFIELYNPGDSPIDLNTYALHYRLPNSQEDLTVYQWNTKAFIPPRGHYLLVRADQDIGIVPDKTFKQSLNTSGGGLALINASGTIADSLGWGKAPQNFSEGTPAPALENGFSLERLPGGVGGNAIDTQNNFADFSLNDSPYPQNSGSPITPAASQHLEFGLSAPETVNPGTQYKYTLTVTNPTQNTLNGIYIQIPIPSVLEIANLPAGFTQDDHDLSWTLGALEAGQSKSDSITVQAPWTYQTVIVQNYFVTGEGGILPTFGGPIITRIEGGSIPIIAARGLMDTEVIIQGIATMYTGGYYAGGGNTKFYIEDETSGIQVQVFGGERLVDVPIGARVRVRGIVGNYRGSIQVVPETVPDDVEILSPPSEEVAVPITPISIQQAANDMETLPGHLVEIDGTATRIEEFSYSYEIDMTNENGQVVTLYVDKMTNATVESLKEGRQYRVCGILEVRDGSMKLYPRTQSDLAEIFPPALLLDIDAPNTVQSGGALTYTLTAHNYTDAPLSNIEIIAYPPAEGAEIPVASDGGNFDGNEIRWIISELAGNGGQASVQYTVTITPSAHDYIQAGSAQANAAEWPEPAQAAPRKTFIGNQVPIWAIQGFGSNSPYVLEELTTSGVVTGVFPGLEGFWIQETTTDDDPTTSEGLFIDIGELEPMVSSGDLIEVSGIVRESSQQTQLMISQPADVQIMSSTNPLPEAIDLNPPVNEIESQRYFEAMEGMLAQVSGPALAIGPTSKYGEVPLTLPEHGLQRLWRQNETGMVILVDDGSFDTHYDSSTLDYVVAAGDSVKNIVGPLAFTYGRYKIEPIAEPEVEVQARAFEPLSEIGENQFSMMTWNVENLFDILDPHPADPPRPRKADYDLALAKVANTILGAGAPTIIALQEVENIKILEDLAECEPIAEFGYQPFLIEGTDSRGIDVGYLLRGDRVQLIDSHQYIAPEGLTSRPPLLIEVEITAGGEPIKLYAINNHFSSMSGGEKATEPRRTAQAAWNATILEGVLADEPDALVAIMGDLNSFYDSPPLDALRQAGLKHVFEHLPEEERYTYVYYGVSQTLDHILVTPPLMGMLQWVDILHIDADYPPPEPGDPSVWHKSDHDPIIVTFGP